MIDLEKVIKGLSCCAKWTAENDIDACNSCPYHHSHFSYDDNNCVSAVNNDAIALLKEQEPKAIEYHDNPYTGLPVAHCPNCKRYARQFHSSVEEETHYCPWCGQAVNWND